MMKKLLALMLTLLMVVSLFACGKKQETTEEGSGTTSETSETTDTAYDYDAIPDTMTSSDGTYKLAFITDIGSLKDASFNEGTWNGVKRYGYENDLSYKYYQPANGAEATDDDRYDAMKAAVDAGAEVVVCAGFLQGTALAKAAAEFADTKFVFIDGWALTDASNNVLTNVAPIAFKEEQCGYFAGYAVVMDGYTKLGFSGGGGNTNPACCRYGYGYVQGAEAAAKEKNVKIEMNYSWEYGSSYSASPELQTMLNGWYENGTEVIFSCGGSMYNSAFAAASANDAWVVGVDSDQSGDSETVLTSAMKGVGEAAMYAIGKSYDGSWADIGGVNTSLGVNDNAVGIPTAASSWRFSTFTVEQYQTILQQVKDGTIVVDDQYPEDMSTYSNDVITITVI